MSTNFFEFRTLEVVVFVSSLLFGLVCSVPVPPNENVVGVIIPQRNFEVDFVDENPSADIKDVDFDMAMVNDDTGDQNQQNVNVWAATSVPFLLTIIGVIFWCCCAYLRCQGEEVNDFKISKTSYSRIQ